MHWSFCTCNSIRWLFAVAFGSSLSASYVDRPSRCVLCTVLRSFHTCHSEQQNLAATLSFALYSAKDVNRPVRGVLSTVLHRFCSCHSKQGPFAAAFDSAPSAEDLGLQNSRPESFTPHITISYQVYESIRIYSNLSCFFRERNLGTALVSLFKCPVRQPVLKPVYVKQKKKQVLHSASHNSKPERFIYLEPKL